MNVMTSPDRILADYGHLAERAARRAWSGDDESILDLDDLRQVAKIALLLAVEHFDGRGHVGAFAMQRISWALVTAQRAAAPLARKHWNEVRSGQANFSRVEVDGLEEEPCGQLVSLATQDTGVMAREVTDAVGRLPSRLRFVVREHYFHHRLLKDIGADLGVNKSRAAQLRGAAVVALRKLLLARRAA